MSELPRTWTTTPFKEVVSALSTDGHVVETREILKSGSLRVLTQGEPSADGYTEDASRAYGDALPLIVFGDHTRAVKLSAEPFAIGPNAKVLATTEALDAKFLFYQLPTLLPPPRGYGRHFQFLAKSRVVVAPYPEQIRIVAAIEEQFSRLDAGVAALERVIGPLTGMQAGRIGQLRSSVLATAFSGKLVPQDPNDEPASVLLERIAAEHGSSNGHMRIKTRQRRRKATA